MMAGALIALAGTVYANSTIYISDGSGLSGALYLASSPSGSVTTSATNIDGWTIRATGTDSGTAQNPTMNVSISAVYGGPGSFLNIYFGSDGFGPTSANYHTALSGSVISGTGGSIDFTNWVFTGSALPTVANPIPSGGTGLNSPEPINLIGNSYSGTANGGPLTMSSYSMEEVITLEGNSGGSGYNINASVTVPEPSVAGMGILAAGALGLMRRRR